MLEEKPATVHVHRRAIQQTSASHRRAMTGWLRCQSVLGDGLGSEVGSPSGSGNVVKGWSAAVLGRDVLGGQSNTELGWLGEERGRGAAGIEKKARGMEESSGRQKGKQSSCSHCGWDTALFGRIARAPAPTMQQKYQVGYFGCAAQEARCSLRTTAVEKVQKAGRMRSRPAEMPASTRGTEARGQDGRGRRWVSAVKGTIGLACASEASFCPTRSFVQTTTLHQHLKLSRANRLLAPGRCRATTQSALACRRDSGRRFRRVMSAQRRPTCVASWILASTPNPLSSLASPPLQSLRARCLGRMPCRSVASWTLTIPSTPDPTLSRRLLPICPSAHPPIPSPHPAQVTNPISHAGLWKQNDSGGLPLSGWSHRCCGGPLSRQHIVLSVSTSPKTTPCRRLISWRLVQLGQHRLCTQP